MAYKSSTIRLDLAELDEFFEGYYVTIRNPRLIPWQTTKQLMLKNDKSTDSALGGIEDIAKSMIADWNVEDPVTGEVLPLPSQDDTSFGKVPSEITQHLIKKITEVFTQAAKKMNNSTAASSTPSSTQNLSTETSPTTTNS